MADGFLGEGESGFPGCGSYQVGHASVEGHTSKNRRAEQTTLDGLKKKESIELGGSGRKGANAVKIHCRKFSKD